MIRHGATDGTFGDPPGFRLDDCATQRNLVDKGREDARRLGRTFTARSIPVTRVLSSAWCRCLETARLAFGRAEVWPPLHSNSRDTQTFPARTREVRAQIGGWRGEGNLVLVSHAILIRAFTGLFPVEGELIVLTPEGGETFRVAGRILPGELDD
ncbi:MAG: histidine phosphatase family protein [Candidatus Rokuibacteriota bacterium]